MKIEQGNRQQGRTDSLLRRAIGYARQGLNVVVYGAHYRHTVQLRDRAVSILGFAAKVEVFHCRPRIEWLDGVGGKIEFRHHKDCGTSAELGERVDVRLTDHYVYER